VKIHSVIRCELTLTVGRWYQHIWKYYDFTLHCISYYLFCVIVSFYSK